jgi:N-acetylglucosaminyldiphosphoundecaprenol N-acetyl-beta-D-mannosaminyltransferase
VTASSDTNRVEILGTPVDIIELDDVIAGVSEWLDEPAGGLRHIVTVNPEYVIAARHHRRFAWTLRHATLSLADGIGIVLAARVLRLPAPKRITGNDLVDAIAGMRHPRKRIFLLGAAGSVAAAAAAVLGERHPDASIVATLSGDPAPGGWPEICAVIESTAPTIIFVAFGHPKQDLWIATYRERLESRGILVASGIGGVYDYLSGRAPRAPGMLRRLGLEWLYRLVRQPWRWRRQTALPVFVVLVMVDAIKSLIEPRFQR